MKYYKILLVISAVFYLSTCDHEFLNPVDPGSTEYQGYEVYKDDEIPEDAVLTISRFSPTASASIFDTTPLLDWEDFLNAVNYQIQIAATGIEISDTVPINVDASGYQIPLEDRFTYGTEYAWRVRVANPGNKYSPWSETNFFEVVPNTNLREIILSHGVLTPDFNPVITEYSVNVSNAVTNIIVTGIPAANDATILGNSGESIDLNDGVNIVRLTVLGGDNNSTKNYDVFVDRSKTEVILHASNVQESAIFGEAVSISGNYALIGAADENDGSVYIFKNDGNGKWEVLTSLHQNEMYPCTNFGDSISISGNYAVVGANSHSTGGFAYIYKNYGSDNWAEITIIQGSDNSTGDAFGHAVSIDGDYALIGTYNKYNGGAGAGAAYLFKNDGSDNWNEIAILSASDKQEYDFFGEHVSINGDYALIGAHFEDGGDGDPFQNSGAAYIYKNDGNDNWNEVAILRSSDPQEYSSFGWSVSIQGDYAIVGAPSENGGAGGTVTNAGAVYIFKNDGNDNWSETFILRASDFQEEDKFGYSVAIDGEWIVVGSHSEDGGEGDSVLDAGAVYLFQNDGSDNWEEVTSLHASDLQTNDLFGLSVSISDKNILVGAPNEDGGIGDPFNDAGAAYIFNNINQNF